MRTIAAVFLWSTLGLSILAINASADPYSEQIGRLEDAVADCINRYGHSACEDFRKQNLRAIEQLYRDQQLQPWLDGFFASYRISAELKGCVVQCCPSLVFTLEGDVLWDSSGANDGYLNT